MICERKNKSGCLGCPNLSEQEVWCCKYGVSVEVEVKMPEIGEMIKGLVGEAVKFLKSGCRLRKRGEVEEILKICAGCEYGKVIWSKKALRCMACGCLMNVKAWGVKTKCKIGKW